MTIASASPDGKVLASQRIDKIIKWPTQAEKDFEHAVAMINSASQEPLREARLMLERLIGENPKLDAGYVELARVAMKTNWGELLDMQGKPDQAIARYREAITRPMGLPAYYEARESAYTRLLQLLEARNDADGMEALYKQRISEFGAGSCYSADYARFKLNVRGDAQSAIDLARGALKLSCDDAPSRQILGLASYVKWAEGSGSDSTEALNQARVFLPAGPMTLCLLASSDSTMSAARKLIAAGEAIDQIDNEQMTALAHALQMGKLEAAERLLRLGARPETPVGVEAMPVALLPVLDGNLDAIRVMQQAGVDYSKLRYRGATALDFAKQMGDDALLEALTRKNRTL